MSQYMVEAIVGHRLSKDPAHGSAQGDFKPYEVSVKWDGYSMEENTWEPLHEKLGEVRYAVLKYFASKHLRPEPLSSDDDNTLFKLVQITPAQAKHKLRRLEADLEAEQQAAQEITETLSDSSLNSPARSTPLKPQLVTP